MSRTFDTEEQRNEGTEGRFDARRVAPADVQQGLLRRPSRRTTSSPTGGFRPLSSSSVSSFLRVISVAFVDLCFPAYMTRIATHPRRV